MIGIALIGAGGCADRHARAIAERSADCRLVGRFDPDGGAGSLERLLREADAAVVASPTELRFHHTALALEHGLDILAEQPVAATVENARMLERMASLRPLRPVLMASSPARFDPVVRELKRALEGHEPIAIEMRRLVPFAEAAGGGTDAVANLMLPDIDLLVALAGSPLVRLHASGHEGGFTVATLVFESGLVGTLTAGLGGGDAQARITATTRFAAIEADTLASTVEIARNSVSQCAQVPRVDPLAAQFETFLRAVRERTTPLVGLRTAAANLEVADSVRECIAIQAAATGTGGVPTR